MNRQTVLSLSHTQKLMQRHKMALKHEICSSSPMIKEKYIETILK